MFLCLTWTIKGRSACPVVAFPNRLFVFPPQSTAVTERVKHRWTPKFLKSILQERSSKFENGDAIYRQLERNFNVDIFKKEKENSKRLLITRVLFLPLSPPYCCFQSQFPLDLSLEGLVRNRQETSGNLPAIFQISSFIYCYVYQVFKVNFWIRGTIFNSR